MLIDTRYFGEIDMDEKKIVHFEHGLFGFEEYKDYTILYDSESEKECFSHGCSVRQRSHLPFRS